MRLNIKVVEAEREKIQATYVLILISIKRLNTTVATHTLRAYKPLLKVHHYKLIKT